MMLLFPVFLATSVVAVVGLNPANSNTNSIMASSCYSKTTTTTNINHPSFDSRGTLSRAEARQVYDKFAAEGHVGGQDAESGYGGPAVTALLEMAEFETAGTVLEYGCGQGKLAELVYSKKKHDQQDEGSSSSSFLSWRGIDQSPNMIQRFLERNHADKKNMETTSSSSSSCTAELLESGDPADVQVEPGSVDRFVSTYCLDLLSEEDIYKVLDLAEQSLHPDRGRLLLAGITWGYRASIQTFVMTTVWEFLYKVKRTKVGGCRPQALQPYLKAKGWQIEKVVETLPDGYPWMVSEVISARPPPKGGSSSRTS